MFINLLQKPTNLADFVHSKYIRELDEVEMSHRFNLSFSLAVGGV